MGVRVPPSTPTLKGKTMEQEELPQPSEEVVKHVATHNPRGIFIVQEGKGGPIFRIETPESYAGRKTIKAGSSSSLKKLARIGRVRKRGYVKRPATRKDIDRYGPPIVMGEAA